MASACAKKRARRLVGALSLNCPHCTMDLAVRQSQPSTLNLWEMSSDLREGLFQVAGDCETDSLCFQGRRELRKWT
jgi:hypothetical protein